MGTGAAVPTKQKVAAKTAKNDNRSWKESARLAEAASASNAQGGQRNSSSSQQRGAAQASQTRASQNLNARGEPSQTRASQNSNARGEASQTRASQNFKCGRCGAVKSIPCGSETFTCDGCGAVVTTQLFQATAPLRAESEANASKLEVELREILEQQVNTCKCLWDAIQDQLVLDESLWSSQELPDEVASASILIREAYQTGDTAQLAAALSHGETMGLGSPSLNDALNRLKDEEELEVVWSCLLKALHSRDHADLECWQQEAIGRGLQVPPGISMLVQQLQGEEMTKLKQMEYQHHLQERVEGAFHMRDETLLNALATEARHVGADPGIVDAKLRMLQGLPPLQGAPSEGGVAQVKKELLLDELRRKSVAQLKHELSRLGASVDDDHSILEKEELVQLLAALRQSMGNAADQGQGYPQPNATQRGASSSTAPSSKAPPKQTSPRSSSKGSNTSGEPTWVCKVCKRLNLYLDDSCFVCGTSQDYEPKPARPGAARSSQQQPGAANSSQQQPPPGAKTHPSASSTGAGTSGKPTPSGKSQPSGPSKPSQNSSKPSQKSPTDDAPPPRKTAGKMTRQKAFACLGLPDQASNEEVRKAYKQAALKWHPDRRQNHGNEEEAKRRFQEAKEAFDHLSKAGE